MKEVKRGKQRLCAMHPSFRKEKKKKILKKLWHTHTKNWNREKHNIKRKQTLNTAMRERIQQRLYVCMAQRFARSKIPLRRRRGLSKPPTPSRVSLRPLFVALNICIYIICVTFIESFFCIYYTHLKNVIYYMWRGNEGHEGMYLYTKRETTEDKV